MSGKINPRKDDSRPWSPSLPSRDEAEDFDKAGGTCEEHHHSEGPGGSDDTDTAYSPKWFP